MQPQQPPALNMSPILQALQRRGLSPTGGGTPMQQQQMSSPPQPNASMSAMPTQVQQGGSGQQSQQNGALQAGQTAQGPQFDSETRDLAKSLVQRLLKGL